MEPGARAAEPQTRSAELRARAELLAAVQRSVAEVVGPGQAAEVLFRLGRGWGREEARRRPLPELEPRQRFEHAARLLRELGLGAVALESFEPGRDGAGCRIVGRVADPSRPGAAGGGGLCGLTAGYLTGVAAAVTGADLVCAAPACEAECPGRGCRFELRPAHERPGPAPGTRTAAGSARFYLDSLGAALGESQISLADLVENTDDAILLIDRNDVIRFWNRGAERLFRYARGEVVGRRIGFLLPRDLLEADELGMLHRLLERDGRVGSFQTRRVRKDGTELRVSLNRTVLHDERGQPIGSTAILRDVTELHEKDSELQQARTLAILGELAARIAHEIKNPLAGISGAIQILQREAGLDDARREVFEGIQQEVQRLDATVHDLLGFARPTQPRLAPTNLRSFVRDVIESVGCSQPLAGYELVIEVPEELIVRMDQRLMGQVLSNLVHNALQAMPHGGTLHISASAGEGNVTVEVADSGRGVAPEHLESVFEPFFTTRSRGTGLGLSIARKNVEAHGGRIEVESTPGKGTRFRLELPLGPPDLRWTTGA